MEKSMMDPGGSLSRRGPRTFAIIAGLALLAVLSIGLFALRGTDATSVAAGQDPAEMVQSAFEDKTGVRVVRVSITGQGGLIDLRYQVVDPDKAAILHEREYRPALIDEATGKLLNTPWMDHGHSGTFRAGVTYYDLLVNSAGVLKRGSVVSVVIGDTRLEHARVR